MLSVTSSGPPAACCSFVFIVLVCVAGAAVGGFYLARFVIGAGVRKGIEDAKRREALPPDFYGQTHGLAVQPPPIPPSTVAKPKDDPDRWNIR